MTKLAVVQSSQAHLSPDFQACWRHFKLKNPIWHLVESEDQSDLLFYLICISDKDHTNLNISSDQFENLYNRPHIVCSDHFMLFLTVWSDQILWPDIQIWSWSPSDIWSHLKICTCYWKEEQAPNNLFFKAESFFQKPRALILPFQEEKTPFCKTEPSLVPFGGLQLFFLMKVPVHKIGLGKKHFWQCLTFLVGIMVL